MEKNGATAECDVSLPTSVEAFVFLSVSRCNGGVEASIWGGWGGQYNGTGSK